MASWGSLNFGERYGKNKNLHYEGFENADENRKEMESWIENMSVKQKYKNWNTNRILAKEERKAEKEEEKLYMRSAVREAKEKRRYKEMEIKAEERANRPSFAQNIRNRISPASTGKKTPTNRRARLEKVLSGFELGGSSKKGGLDFGLGGKGGFDLGTPKINFGIGGTRRKGKKKKDDWFGGFV